LVRAAEVEVEVEVEAAVEAAAKFEVSSARNIQDLLLLCII
jgi:hypothetical protein